MTDEWNPKHHKITFNESTDNPGTYEAEIICDEKVVYHVEKPYHNRFTLMQNHDEFLNVVEEYKKKGILPLHASLLIRKNLRH